MGGFTPYEKYNTLCISVLQNHPSHTLGFATTTRQELASARSSAHKKKKRPTLFSRPLCISGRKGEGLPVDHKVEIAGDGVDFQRGEQIPVTDITVADIDAELTGIPAGNTVEITDNSEILREGNGNAS